MYVPTYHDTDAWPATVRAVNNIAGRIMAATIYRDWHIVSADAPSYTKFYQHIVDAPGCRRIEIIPSFIQQSLDNSRDYLKLCADFPFGWKIERLASFVILSAHKCGGEAEEGRLTKVLEICVD